MKDRLIQLALTLKGGPQIALRGGKVRIKPYSPLETGRGLIEHAPADAVDPLRVERLSGFATARLQG